MTDLATVDDAEKQVEERPELREKVKNLRLQVEEGYWELSQALQEVYDSSAYVTWGYDSWKEYVEGELEFQVRKAQYLVSIAAWFGKLNKGVQKWVAALGWSRAKELVGKVTNENAAEWKKKIEGKTVLQIQEMLKANRDSGGEGGGDGGDGDGSSSSSDKATRWTFSLFTEQRETVEAAMELAKKTSQSDKEGNNLTLICTEYMANNAAIESADEYLARVEKTLGVKIVAYQESTESVVYGEKLLDELFPEAEDEG